MTLEVSNLMKSYKDKVALNGISFKMNAGIYTIIGLNGSGKTTIMKLLVDLLPRTDGNVLYNGVDILELGEKYRSKVGYVPQEQAYISDFSGKDYLYYMAELKDLDKKSAKSNIEELLKQFNLWQVRNKKMNQYSTGMRQRIIICQALLGNPEIIILDEPTIGLDISERIKFKEYIKRISYEKIIIYSTHIISDVIDIADYILLLKNGNIIKNCKMDDFLRSIGNCENLENRIVEFL